MKIKEITYEKSVLTPTGQYGNIRLGAIITYSLEDGEEPNHQRARTDLNTAIEYQKTGTEAKSTLETEFPDKPPFGQDNPPVSQTPVATANVAADGCPKCGSPLKEARKKDGTPYQKCSTNKWDRVTGTATGCDYVDWGTGTRPAQVGGKLASPAQERIIKAKWPTEWVDGMTMSEAYQVIASHPK
jgi:hypothetical protein